MDETSPYTLNQLPESAPVEKKHAFASIWLAIRTPVLAFLAAIGAGALLIVVTDTAVMGLALQAIQALNIFKDLLLILALAVLVAVFRLYFSSRAENLPLLKRLSPGLQRLAKAGLIVLGLGITFLLLLAAGFGESMRAALAAASLAYASMAEGSLGNLGEMSSALRSGDQQALLQAFNPISESLVSATPYIFSGLSVAIALRCGIFNIGTEGQLFMGAIFSVVVGFGLKGLPFYIHMPLAVLAGAAGGALWALIPAILKTRFGSNEVINTIMLNYVAFGLNGWLLNGPIRRADESKPVSEYIQHSAELTTFFAYPNRLHLGIFIAIGVAIFLYWFLFRTTFGLEIRTVGQNPNAARYSGMNITRSYIIAFCISGALGGLAGANEVLGVNHYLSGAISPGYGFDAISLSILGNNHPIGVILTSLLFGTLRNGGTRMQNIARVPAEIITVVQSLVVAFIAAPAIIKALFRIKSKSDDRLVLTRGWGK